MHRDEYKLLEDHDVESVVLLGTLRALAPITLVCLFDYLLVDHCQTMLRALRRWRNSCDLPMPVTPEVDPASIIGPPLDGLQRRFDVHDPGPREPQVLCQFPSYYISATVGHTKQPRSYDQACCPMTSCGSFLRLLAAWERRIGQAGIVLFRKGQPIAHSSR